MNNFSEQLACITKMLCLKSHDAAPSETRRLSPLAATLLVAVCVSLPITAAILPEDRADALYHRYQGGGVVIDGPSVLVRKQAGKHVSVLGNYYVDSITSASHDVVTQGSPYTEFREEYRLGVDMVYDNATMNLTYANSEESDYKAKTYSFSVSHAMFGDLTTVSLGYTFGTDIVGMNTSTETVIRDNDTRHYKYRFGVSQVLTGKLIMGLNLETITDEGFLNNPYRSVRTNNTPCAIPPCPQPYVSEVYPRTRTSNTISINGKYYLPWRAALSVESRSMADTWDITANMFKIGYVQPIRTHWMLEFEYRTYSQQTRASFYSEDIVTNNLPFYRASDKEMSTMASNTLGVGLGYEFGERGFWIFDKGSVNAKYSRIAFDYADFTNKIAGDPGEGQPYSFTASVLRFFVSLWY